MIENGVRDFLSANDETATFHVRLYVDGFSRSGEVNFLFITGSTAITGISSDKSNCSSTMLCWRAEGRARLMFSRDTGVDVS